MKAFPLFLAFFNQCCGNNRCSSSLPRIGRTYFPLINIGAEKIFIFFSYFFPSKGYQASYKYCGAKCLVLGLANYTKEGDLGDLNIAVLGLNFFFELDLM